MVKVVLVNEISDKSKSTTIATVLKLALKYSLATYIFLIILAVLFGRISFGVAGMLAVSLGAFLGGGFLLISFGVLYFLSKINNSLVIPGLIVVFLFKLIVLLFVLWILRQQTYLNLIQVGITILISWFLVFGVLVITILKSKFVFLDME